MLFHAEENKMYTQLIKTFLTLKSFNTLHAGYMISNLTKGEKEQQFF